MIGSYSMFSVRAPGRSSVIVIHDVLVVTIALPLALLLRDSSLASLARIPDIVFALALLAAIAAITGLLVGVQRGVWRYVGTSDLGRIARFLALTLLVFYIVQFSTYRLDWAPRSLPVIHFLVAYFLLVTARMAYAYRCREEARAGVSRTAARTARAPLLLIGSGDGAALVVHLLRHQNPHGQEVAGILANGYRKGRDIDGVPVLGSLGDFEQVLETLRVQDMLPSRVVVTCPHHVLGREAVYRVLTEARAAKIPVVQLPDLVRLRFEPPPQSGPEEVSSDPPDTPPLYPVVKRLWEMTVAGIVLVAFAPLIAVVASLVAIFIQSPVLFVQVRPGQHRQPFILYKFRTMRDPLDRGGRRLTDDQRTPWLGRLLRRTRLDELPQLWNVLIGDMAIIGPRPLLARDLDAMPDRGIARSRMRPGLTGWAQVNGGHQLTSEEKLALDLWYGENASLALDLRIVVRTLAMMAFGEKRDTQAIDRAFQTVGLPVAASTR